MKRPKSPPLKAPKPFHNPFGALRDRLGSLPKGPEETSTVPVRSSARVNVPKRAVIRLERKGRGGKEVTLVKQLGLEPREMARWLGELKRSLGCGGTVEGPALLFQGDQRERLEAALRSRGVERISV